VGFIVYPAVDILEGRCVRLLQGRFGSESVYSDDPVQVALGFCRAGARWLHIVDLEGAKTGERVNREIVLEVVRRAACPVQAGGGLRTVDDVEEMIAAGAGRAVMGTAALEDPPAVARACKRFGERIAVSLDVKGATLAAHGWTEGSGMPVVEAVHEFESLGVTRFIYTDVSKDGTLTGPNIKAILKIAAATNCPVVASGGIGSINELKAVARLHEDGIAGVIVGRAFYEHKFTVGEAKFAADAIVAGRDGEMELEGESEGR
jgi:phosphoribosylformimino-5-aminoimidazole carboxamide ribotide isomerase